MAAGETTQGRRVPADTPIHELQPGDYRWDGGSILWGCAPDGQICRIDGRWSIAEHVDGTITVGPQAPSGASSIWINKPVGWHGYLERGVWRSV